MYDEEEIPIYSISEYDNFEGGNICRWKIF